MVIIHKPDAYTHIFDNRNAIDEYFKLKHQLALDDNERYRLYSINNTPDIPDTRILPEGITENSTLTELIEGLKFYKEQNRIKDVDLADEIGINRITLYSLLKGKRQRLQEITRFKLAKLLRGN